MTRIAALPFFLAIVAAGADAQSVPRPRERDLALPIGGTAGRLDAITDVAGVEVGFTTLIEGEGRLVVGKGPMRTGVTVVFPRGKDNLDPVFANWYAYNGNGEMTGTTWITEGGFLEGPIGITNTHSVGVVRDAIIAWETRGGRRLVQPWQLPVAAETYDGGQNDINGFHVKPEHVLAALEGAKGGAVPAEGNVGGVPVGRELADTLLACTASSDPSVAVRFARRCAGFEVPGEQLRSLPFGRSPEDGILEEGQGSMIVVVATDAPLLPNQIERLLKRLPGGLAREGNVAGNGDGDIFIGFSTANARAAQDTAPSARFVSNARIAPLFEATAQALEAAITNGLLAGEMMTGAEYRRLYALPVGRLRAIFAKYGQPLEK